MTVRVNEANKLVRIYVVDDKVGFTPEAMDFDSVVDLIEHYRNCSLEEHNSALITSLKFPLIRGQRNESPMPSIDADVISDQVPKRLAQMKQNVNNNFLLVSLKNSNLKMFVVFILKGVAE